ncbi:hypothetical protein H0A64_07005 [Alcaligenaceae bacterium]|nr:hypothetical protein [Alcaligenaceae bacterium]
MNIHNIMKLMPEVVAALKATGQNVSLAEDLEATIAIGLRGCGEPSDEEIYAAAKRFYKYECDDNPLSGIADFDEVGFARDLLARYGQPAQPSVPEGWKIVPDYKPGMVVKFGGEDYLIFALGDKPGTFDICHPTDSHRDRWVNVPPSQLEPIEAAPTPPAADQAQQDADKVDAERRRIGQAINDFMAQNEREGDPGQCALDWCDSDNVDALIDAIDAARDQQGDQP